MVRSILLPLGIWAIMAVIAVINGGIRETFLIPQIGDYPGHVVSTGVLVVAILAVSFLFFSHVAIDYSRTQLLLIGIGWAILTVGFEFVVGAVEGTPPSTTIAQYDVLAGQVWILVPLTLLTSPLLFGHVLLK